MTSEFQARMCREAPLVTDMPMSFSKIRMATTVLFALLFLKIVRGTLLRPIPISQSSQFSDLS
jgi:hypothetical protein